LGDNVKKRKSARRAIKGEGIEKTHKNDKKCKKIIKKSVDKKRRYF